MEREAGRESLYQAARRQADELWNDFIEQLRIAYTSPSLRIVNRIETARSFVLISQSFIVEFGKKSFPFSVQLIVREEDPIDRLVSSSDVNENRATYYLDRRKVLEFIRDGTFTQEIEDRLKLMFMMDTVHEFTHIIQEARSWKSMQAPYTFFNRDSSRGIDLGTPEGLATARQYFLSSREVESVGAELYYYLKESVNPRHSIDDAISLFFRMFQYFYNQIPGLMEAHQGAVIGAMQSRFPHYREVYERRRVDQLKSLERSGQHRLVDRLVHLATIELNKRWGSEDLRETDHPSGYDSSYDIYEGESRPDDTDFKNKYGTMSYQIGRLNLEVHDFESMDPYFQEVLRDIGKDGSNAIRVEWLGMPPELGVKYMFSVIKMLGQLMEKHGLPIIFEAKEDTSFRFLQSDIVRRYIESMGYKISKTTAGYIPYFGKYYYMAVG